MLIAFTGLAGSGKSTAARVLMTKGFARVKMADTLKNMTRAFLADVIPSASILEDYIEGNLKETPIPLLGGKTPRQIMQTLGTEWGRDLVSSSLWVDINKMKIDALMAKGIPVVNDDIRFQNEVDFVRERGGYIVEIFNPKLTKSDTHLHISESPIKSDIQIMNNFDSALAFQNYIAGVFSNDSRIKRL